MALKLYNTLTKTKEVFKPRKDKRVNLFVCGPTVYDFSHIGHARTYIFFDTFARYLKFLGYNVFYLQNITDVDDRIIKRAKEERRNIKVFARQYEKEFLADMKRLGVRSVTEYAPATKFIPQIINQVSRLLEKGYAYQIDNDGIYFNIAKFKDYGKLAGRTTQQAEDGVSRIDESVNKKNKGDFALWKFSSPRQGRGEKDKPSWPSPWGAGRPGWHIEDTAISEHFFGPQYDIHGGAIDLIFPHHESEIAQQEASSSKKPFVRYWLHTGFLTTRGEKMSKSLGNFISIRDALKKAPPEILRLLISIYHYRSPIEYSDRLLEQAKAASERLENFLYKVDYLLHKKGGLPTRVTNGDKEWMTKLLEKTKNDFYANLNDDFNTPKAFSVLFDFIKETNPKLDRGRIGKKDLREINNFFKDIDSIFGILRKEISAIPKTVEALATRREELRALKQWHKADAIRIKIEKMGYVLEDTPVGIRIRKR